MRTNKLIVAILLLASIGTLEAANYNFIFSNKAAIPRDSTRLLELDAYWHELSRTVREGDFSGYAAAYHHDAVVIFAVGEDKRSLPISKALEGWKQGFQDTKAGKTKSNVEFRLSQRIGDATTAHETGIFHYTSLDSSGNQIANSYVHMEMLFIKLNDRWYSLLEYQKSMATEEEWQALK